MAFQLQLTAQVHRDVSKSDIVMAAHKSGPGRHIHWRCKILSGPDVWAVPQIHRSKYYYVPGWPGMDYSRAVYRTLKPETICTISRREKNCSLFVIMSVLGSDLSKLHYKHHHYSVHLDSFIITIQFLID